jgi:hypothetical protein
MFIRTKTINNAKYAYLVESTWSKGKTKQKVKQYLGKVTATLQTPKLTIQDVPISKEYTSAQNIDILITCFYNQLGFLPNYTQPKSKLPQSQNAQKTTQVRLFETEIADQITSNLQHQVNHNQQSHNTQSYKNKPQKIESWTYFVDLKKKKTITITHKILNHLGKESCFEINEGFLCSQTLKDIKLLPHTLKNAEKKAEYLAHTLIGVGLNVDKELFIAIYNVLLQ